MVHQEGLTRGMGENQVDPRSWVQEEALFGGRGRQGGQMSIQDMGLGGRAWPAEGHTG